jgi:hypothetical protein
MQVHAGTVNEEVVLDDCFSTSAYSREKAKGHVLEAENDGLITQLITRNVRLRTQKIQR